jgi:AP endonuclease 2
MNPPNMFKNGKRRREWNQKDLLPLSAKLIPEFDRRQSIRDMFSRQTSSTTLIPSDLEPIHSSQPAIADTTKSTAQQSAHSPATPDIIPTKSELPVSALQPSRASKRIHTSPDEQSIAKRSKSSPEVGDSTKSKKGPNQTTLRGFFRPKDASTRTSVSSAENGNQTSNPPRTKTEVSYELEELKPASPKPILQYSKEDTPSVSIGETVFDPIQAKESWSKLLGKRVVPRCEHNEPCISLVTKKAGINCGKYSLICSLDHMFSPDCFFYFASRNRNTELLSRSLVLHMSTAVGPIW